MQLVLLLRSAIGINAQHSTAQLYLHLWLDQLAQSVAFAWLCGEEGKKLEEVAPRHCTDVQILTHHLAQLVRHTGK